MFLYGSEEEHGAAGDTGTALHRAVAALHLGNAPGDCLAIVKEGSRRYPLADLADASALFLAYASDPRNRNARVVLVEHAIKFHIAPAPEDPTQAPIVVEGQLDQVRQLQDGSLELWDLKSSKKEPMTLLRMHAVQAAAYCVGASIALQRPVKPGGLILPRKYRQGTIPTSPVFWKFPWKLKDTEHILAGVRHAVARIRNSDIWHLPGDYCEWCPQKTPDLCLPRLQEELRLRTHDGGRIG